MKLRISWKVAFCALLLVAVGIVAGLLTPRGGWRTPAGESHQSDSHQPPDYDHVDVSRTAQASLGLKLGKVEPASYTAAFLVPMIVVERPAVSDLHVVTEFEGIVEEIFAVPGQIVHEGTPLFRIRLTGDTLATSQAALLDAVEQATILRQEIARLRPTVEQGGLAGRRILELEYELKRLSVSKEAKRQELLIRGLTEEQLAQIAESGQLVRTVTVSLPPGLMRPLRRHQATDAAPKLSSDDSPLTIESLEVTPGSYVRPGDPLCNLAHHASLYLMGHAFERDVDAIAAAIAGQIPVTAELGDDREPIELDGLSVVHLDNHVDPVTQTYRFYVELENEVLQDSVLDDGRRFRSWRFRPGQRGHIRLPRQTYSDVFVLPAAAVTRDGLDHVVFRQQPHNHAHAVEHEHDDEFVPVRVAVLYRDRRQVAVALGGDLRPGQVIAMNSAYQLLLAMKSQAGDQDHHGHDH